MTIANRHECHGDQDGAPEHGYGALMCFRHVPPSSFSPQLSSYGYTNQGQDALRTSWTGILMASSRSFRGAEGGEVTRPR